MTGSGWRWHSTQACTKLKWQPAGLGLLFNKLCRRPLHLDGEMALEKKCASTLYALHCSQHVVVKHRIVMDGRLAIYCNDRGAVFAVMLDLGGLTAFCISRVVPPTWVDIARFFAVRLDRHSFTALCIWGLLRTLEWTYTGSPQSHCAVHVKRFSKHWMGVSWFAVVLDLRSLIALCILRVALRTGMSSSSLFFAEYETCMRIQAPLTLAHTSFLTCSLHQFVHHPIIHKIPCDWQMFDACLLQNMGI